MIFLLFKNFSIPLAKLSKKMIDTTFFKLFYALIDSFL